MRTRTNSSNVIVWLAACATAGVVGAYTVGYFLLCERFGTETFEEVVTALGGTTYSEDGTRFLDRMYPNEWYAKIFSPAAKLESWLTNVEVRAIDRSKRHFDFTIDNNTSLSSTAPDRQSILETPPETVDLASLGITVDSDGFVLCEVCQRRLSAVINRGGYLLTCRTCRTDSDCCLWSEVGPSWHDSIDVYREGEEKPMLTGIASEIWQEVDRLSEDGNVIVIPSEYDLDD